MIVLVNESELEHGSNGFIFGSMPIWNESEIED